MPPARWKLRLRALPSPSRSAVGRDAHGQSAVLYDGDVCLGGGVIAAVNQHAHRLRPGGAFVMPLNFTIKR